MEELKEEQLNPDTEQNDRITCSPERMELIEEIKDFYLTNLNQEYIMTVENDPLASDEDSQSNSWKLDSSIRYENESANKPENEPPSHITEKADIRWRS